MAAATADLATQIDATFASRYNRGDVAANAKIFRGTAIAKNATGYVVPASDTAGLKVIGLAEETVDNTGGADGAKTVGYVTCLVAELNNAGGAIGQAQKHTFCYVADDNSVTTAAVATNDIPMGTVVSFTTTKVRVFIDERANA